MYISRRRTKTYRVEARRQTMMPAQMRGELIRSMNAAAPPMTTTVLNCASAMYPIDVTCGDSGGQRGGKRARAWASVREHRRMSMC